MVSPGKTLRTPTFVALVISVLVFAAIAGLRARGSLEYLELELYDEFLSLQASSAPLAERRVLLITVSESDIQSLGQWPLTDEMLARAIETLLENRPRAVGIDIYRDIPVPPGSERLSELFSRNGQLVGVMTFGKRGVPSLSSIDDDQIGFNDILVDPGGTVRRGLLFLDSDDKAYYSFSLRLALLYLRGDGILPSSDPEYPDALRLNGVTIRPFESNDGAYIQADSRGYQFLLDFRNAAVPYATYSFSDLLDGKVPPEAVSEKIVLLGVNASSVKDLFYIPLSRGLGENQQVPGVVLHAYIASQLLRMALDASKQIMPMEEHQEYAWILLWSLVGGLVGIRMGSAVRFSIFGVAGLLAVVGFAYAAFAARWWIPAIPPALTFILSSASVSAYMTSREKKDRMLMMQLFSRHVSKEVAETIWTQRDQFLNNGRPRSQKMTVTVFFSDLKGFTPVAEQMDPEDLIHWLNTYMESMVRLIMDHGGVIDDYAGDGIKANFGVPVPRKDEDGIRRDAENAVRSALAMEQEMSRLNAVWREKGLPEMGIRIGIHTGPVVAGLLGGSERLKYTTVGDTVNIAARLESYDKTIAGDGLCRILVGDGTSQYLNSHYETEEVGTLVLKGKGKTVKAYRVVSGRDATSDPVVEEGIQWIS